MFFLNIDHKTNFDKLINQTKLNLCDTERLALFYIISGNDDLFKKKFEIYDFNDNEMNFKTFKQMNVDFCSSSRALIRLGANLFNGYADKSTNPTSLFGCLDFNNYKLAINAIKLRFEYF